MVDVICFVGNRIFEFISRHPEPTGAGWCSKMRWSLLATSGAVVCMTAPREAPRWKASNPHCAFSFLDGCRTTETCAGQRAAGSILALSESGSQNFL